MGKETKLQIIYLFISQLVSVFNYINRAYIYTIYYEYI